MYGKLTICFFCVFHVLRNLLLIYICNLHWNPPRYSRGNQNGDTGLHIAALRKDVELVRLLIAYGAGVDCSNSSGDTPLIVACSCNESTVVSALLEHHAEINKV